MCIIWVRRSLVNMLLILWVVDKQFCNPKAHAMSIRKDAQTETRVHSCIDTTWKTHGLKQTCTHVVIQFVTPLLAPYDLAWEKDCELNRLAGERQ
jgi:hypothetical protein